MPPGHGLRSRIRGLFARPYRNSAVHEGMPHKSSRSHKIGDYVDIKVNGSPGEGMPHELYHGRTGRVWKVTKRAIGVEINDQVTSLQYFFEFQFRFVVLKVLVC